MTIGASVPRQVFTPTSRAKVNASRNIAPVRLNTSLHASGVVGRGQWPRITSGPQSSRSKSSAAPKWYRPVGAGRNPPQRVENRAL